jgi:hypothetical protein
VPWRKKEELARSKRDSLVLSLFDFMMCRVMYCFLEREGGAKGWAYLNRRRSVRILEHKKRRGERGRENRG